MRTNAAMPWRLPCCACEGWIAARLAPSPYPFAASRAIMLDMLSLGLPLDLPAHLAVQLPCLVLLLRRMHTCCDMPVSACCVPVSQCREMPCFEPGVALVPSCPAKHLLLYAPQLAVQPRCRNHAIPFPPPDQLHRPASSLPQLLANPTQRGRIAALHAAAAGGAGLFVSPDQLLGGPRAQCTSLLAFLLLYCGGVLPTVAVMHWTWLSLRATAGFDMWRRHTEQHQEGISTPSSLGSVSSSRAGSSGALSAQSEAVGGSEAGSNEGMDLQAQAALIRGKPEGEAAPRCWLCTAAAAQHLPHWAVWLLEQAFPPVEGLPAAHACVYLPLLAAGCWLAACVLALATS